MKYLVKFTVTGRGDFPFDMLRYDRCWPMEESWEGSYGLPGHEPRSVKLAMYSPRKGARLPTVARWDSFGWTVDTDSIEEIRR